MTYLKNYASGRGPKQARENFAMRLLYRCLIVIALVAPTAGVSASPERSLLGASLDTTGGRERIVLELSEAPIFRRYEAEDGSQVLELRDTRVTDKARQELRSLRGHTIEGVRLMESRGVVSLRVRADARENTPIRAGHRVLWLFEPAEVKESPRAGRTVAREAEIETPEAAGFLTMAPSSSRRPQFAGRRIDLDFKDADIHNILRLLAEVGQVNIVTADNVSGSVTIRMKNVPWDEALHVILQAKGLGMVRRDNLIRVAPLQALEQEFEAELARRRAQVQLAPLETRIVPVAYAKADDMAARAKDLISERGTVSVDSRTNVMIINDMAAKIESVGRVVRGLCTQMTEVVVGVRVGW